MPTKENGGGTKAIPVIPVVLRGIQRSGVNSLAASRKIPIRDAPPLSITYTRARTRAGYRKSIEEVYNLLINMEGPLASLIGPGRQHWVRKIHAVAVGRR